MNTQEEYQELTRKFEREHGRNSNETLKINIPSMRWFISQSFALGQRDMGEKIVKELEETERVQAGVFETWDKATASTMTFAARSVLSDLTKDNK